jgi:biopolymer transport protein ExbB
MQRIKKTLQLPKLITLLSVLMVASLPSALPLSVAAATELATGAIMPQTVPAALSPLPHDLSLVGMLVAADGVIKTVMGCLVLASVMTWTIWVAKSLELHKAKQQARDAAEMLQACRTVEEARGVVAGSTNPVHIMIEAVVAEIALSEGSSGDGIKERTASRLERIEAEAQRRMASGLGVLASIGSNSPFIGLFGTVWGIMNSFIGISRAHTTNLAVVAPGIAEALLATAMGLVAAIPAVILYNCLIRSVGAYRDMLGDLSATTLRLVSRDLDRGSTARSHNHPPATVRVAMPRSAAE